MGRKLYALCIGSKPSADTSPHALLPAKGMALFLCTAHSGEGLLFHMQLHPQDNYNDQGCVRPTMLPTRNSS